MKVIIDRNKWYRGLGANDSRLLRRDNQMCCLGFYSQACGYTKKQILNQGDPEEIVLKTKENYFHDEAFVAETSQSELIDKIIEINDDKDLSEEKREDLLRRKFKELGIEVEFMN